MAKEAQVRLKLAAQVAGLAATGWVVWAFSVAPRLGKVSFWVIAGQALKHTALACVWSAAITLFLYLVVTRSLRREALAMALRMSATAVWFAPATILLTEFSPLAFGAALLLVMSATRLLFEQWRSLHPEQRPPGLAPAVATALAIQTAAVAPPLGYPLIAGVALCWFVAMLTLLCVMGGLVESSPPRSLPRSLLGAALTVILAAGLTVGGLAGHLRSGSGWTGGVESLREMLARMFVHAGDGSVPRKKVTPLYEPPLGQVEVIDKSFPGVVLVTEQPLPKPLQVPPAALQSGEISLEVDKPLSIPFAGQYWMFRPPSAQPPQKSYTRRGSPVTLSFMTTDRIPMIMEAHQKLEHAIDLSCCREIQVEVSNADKFPGTVTLELILIDGAAGRWVSLGSADVTTHPAGGWRGPAVPVTELLRFAVAGGVRQFDEIKVVFHRAKLRVDRSARVAIERFFLVPR